MRSATLCEHFPLSVSPAASAIAASPVREPQPERVPAVRLWMLSDDFRKQSPSLGRIIHWKIKPFVSSKTIRHKI